MNAGQVMTTSQEQRQEYRLHSVETVFIEVAAASFDGQQAAKVVVTNSVDLSANGLQVTLPEALEIGRIFQISVQLRNTAKRVQLATEVMWVRPAESGFFLVGLALLDSDESGLLQWKTLLADKLVEDF